MRANLKALSRRGRMALGAAATAVIVGAGTGTAWAAGAFTSSIPDANGTIHACIASSGTLRTLYVVDASTTTCPGGYAPLAWSQTGPTGPTGPRGGSGQQGPSGPSGASGTHGATGPSGPSGARGSAGPSGPSGATGASGVSKSQTLYSASPVQVLNNGGGVIVVSPSCPAGWTVTGGAYYSTHDYVTIHDSFPWNSSSQSGPNNVWRVTVTNTGPGTDYLTVGVICVQ